MTNSAKQGRAVGASGEAMTTFPKVALTQAAEVEFKGLFKVRVLLGEDGKRRVVPNDLAGCLGVDRDSLQKRVRRTFRKGAAIMTVPSQGGPQDMLVLDLAYLPAVLLGVDVGRVRPELRARIEEIQDELHVALANYTFGGVAVNPAFPASAAPDLAMAQMIATVVGEALTRALAPLVDRVTRLEQDRQPKAPRALPRSQPVALLAGKKVERDAILLALESRHWNRSAAAQDVGIPRRTFYRRLESYGIQGGARRVRSRAN